MTIVCDEWTLLCSASRPKIPIVSWDYHQEEGVKEAQLLPHISWWGKGISLCHQVKNSLATNHRWQSVQLYATGESCQLMEFHKAITKEWKPVSHHEVLMARKQSATQVKFSVADEEKENKKCHFLHPFHTPWQWKSTGFHRHSYTWIKIEQHIGYLHANRPIRAHINSW